MAFGVPLLVLLSAGLVAAQLPTFNQGSGSKAAPAPAPSASVTTSANTSGSLGYYCSTRSGVQQLVQSAASNAAYDGLNVSIPSSLQDATSLSNIASVSHRRKAASSVQGLSAWHV